MVKNYERPELKVIMLEIGDVITSSVENETEIIGLENDISGL